MSAPVDAPGTPASRPAAVRELATLFLRLGVTAFGGPAAHMAMFEDEVVRRRRWITREQFLDMLGATNLIPGPNSTEMAIHIGHTRAGLPGVLVAGSAFILPAAVITLVLAWAYVRFGALPEATAFLYGAKPAIVAVVLQAVWRLGRTALRSRSSVLAASLALAAVAAGVHELVVLFGAGALLAAAEVVRRRPGGQAVLRTLPPWLPLLSLAASAAPPAAYSLAGLFLFFLKVGSVLFGSGYVLLAFLRADLVERRRWLTNEQLLDAIAVGQLTPGPVFTTATFVGYLLGRTPGALVATLGIFLPAFVFATLIATVLPRLRHSTVAAAFLDGVNAVSLALLAWVTWTLLLTAIVDWRTGAIALGGVALLARFGLNSAWLILGGGVLGLVGGGGTVGLRASTA